MSSPIPEFSNKGSKGRGRGRNLDRNSPSPVGRREESQSCSPGSTPHVDSDVKVRSRPAGRGKARRPEIQRYVPRGRRQPGEDTNSQRQNESSDKKSLSPRPRETRDKPVIGGHESSTIRRDETPESWDRLADDDIKEPNEDTTAVELTSESTCSPASKKSKTDIESSDHCNEPDELQSQNSILSQTDQSNVLPPALSPVQAHPQPSSIPQHSLASDDSADNATNIPFTSMEDNSQMPQQNSNDPSSISNNVHVNSKVEVYDDKGHSQGISSDSPNSDMNTKVAICNDRSDLPEVTNAIEGDKLPADTEIETFCVMDTSEGPNNESDMIIEVAKSIPETTIVSTSPASDVPEIATDVKLSNTDTSDTSDNSVKSESDMIMEVAESIPETTAEKDNPTFPTSPTGDVPEVTTDVKLSNTDTSETADSVRSKSDNISIESTSTTVVHPLVEDESSSVLAPEETSQDGNSLAETPKEPEADTSKKSKKKKDKSKKKDKKSKTDNDEETVEKPKKKKSKADKTKEISKNDNDTGIKNVNEETGKEVKGQDCRDEESEGKVKTDNADDDDDDEDDWDKMFDDNGDCLEPELIDELASHVGQVAIDKPKIDYLAYQPKDADLSSSAYHHLIEIYDFPTDFVTSDLLMSFKSYMNKGFDIKWVDDTHAIGVFSSAVAAQDAVKMIHPLFKVRSIEMASKQSKLKAKKTAEFLMPYKERPKTTAIAARRLVSGALGLTSKISKEKSDQERSQLKEAKEKRKNERQLKQDIWDGSVSKCAMDNS